ALKSSEHALDQAATFRRAWIGIAKTVEIGGKRGFAMHCNGMAWLGVQRLMRAEARERRNQNAAHETPKRPHVDHRQPLWCVARCVMIRQRPPPIADHGLTGMHLKAKSPGCHEVSVST